MHSKLLTSNKGFSILIALGSIGVLMVIVIGMVQVFLTEMKLSRYQYDYILASEQVEGAFEYAMLKVANHRDGFQDELHDEDLDQVLFSGSTERTSRNKVSYKIFAQTGSMDRSILPGEYLIFPLFVGDEAPIVAGKPSKNPSQGNQSLVSANLRMTLSSNPEDISWNIVAMSGTSNTSISGTGEITGLEVGVSRMQGVECFDNTGNAVPLVGGSCPDAVIAAGGEALQYFYDATGSVDDFMKVYGHGSNTHQIKDPYFLIFNKGGNPIDISIASDPTKPFSLPTLGIVVEARKGNAVQTIRFTSDKSKYYDGLKYSLYDTY